MWKWLIFALAGYALYRMFMNDRNKKTEESAKDKEKMVATGEMVKDPVCGAYIDAESPIAVRNGSTVIRFCSYDCRDEYLKSIGKLPEKTGEDEE